LDGAGDHAELVVARAIAIEIERDDLRRAAAAGDRDLVDAQHARRAHRRGFFIICRASRHENDEK
jgi:hypothetical protein